MGCRHFAAVWGGGMGDKKANSEVVIKNKNKLGRLTHMDIYTSWHTFWGEEEKNENLFQQWL